MANLKNVEVFIEMPKGETRRLHLGYDKKGFVDLGQIKNVIPVNDGIMPIAYGFIMGTLQTEESEKNPNEIPDEIDILVYSKKSFKVGEITRAVPISMLVIENGDHKVVAVDETTSSTKKWEDIPADERDLLIRYFGYKSPIVKINGAKEAYAYIEKHRVKIRGH
jgi:inorganic pyrophosphatase